VTVLTNKVMCHDPNNNASRTKTVEAVLDFAEAWFLGYRARIGTYPPPPTAFGIHTSLSLNASSHYHTERVSPDSTFIKRNWFRAHDVGFEIFRA
ncbi:hypothetical protein ACN38_g13059, partial [Penicillium nordicum]